MVIEKLIKYHYGEFIIFDGLTTLGWILIIYFCMVIFNIGRLAMCRCGAISIRGFLLSFIPPIIVDFIIKIPKVDEWYSSEEHS